MSDAQPFDTTAWREVHERTESTAFGATWGIRAPWAHPIWRDYVLGLYDLTTKVPGLPEPVLHLRGATHELLLWPVARETPLVPDVSLAALPFVRLSPNLGYQLWAASDAHALARVQAAVDAVLAGRLSPDADFRWQWDRLFADGAPLVTDWLAGLAAAAGHR